MNADISGLRQWLAPVAAAAAGVVLGLLVHQAAYAVLRRSRRFAEPQTPAAGTTLLDLTRAPTRLAAVLAGLNLAAALFPWPVESVQAAVRHGLQLAWIVAAAWGVIRATFILEQALSRRYDTGTADNYRARKVLTQYKIIQRIVSLVVILLAVAGMFMTFDALRGVGASMLASAGVASVVVGFAAQKTIANVLASIQIAFAQPFRMDDVVIVEGEWGRIEEIHFTFVVVRIWDERRLIVPVSWFIENSFQNWTHKSAQLLGTAMVHADYTVDVDRVRDELTRVLENEGAELWDGRVNLIQVTEATERTVALRALVSAADAGTLWNLRCLVREKLIAHLATMQPGALPTERERRLDAEEARAQSGREQGGTDKDGSGSVGDEPVRRSQEEDEADEDAPGGPRIE